MKALFGGKEGFLIKREAVDNKLKELAELNKEAEITSIGLWMRNTTHITICYVEKLEESRHSGDIILLPDDKKYKHFYIKIEKILEILGTETALEARLFIKNKTNFKETRGIATENRENQYYFIQTISDRVEKKLLALG